MWKKYIWQLGGCTVFGSGVCAAGYLAWKNNIFKTSQGNALSDSNDSKNNQDSEIEKSEINSDSHPNNSIEEQLSSEKSENTDESLKFTSNEDQTEMVVVRDDYEHVTTDTEDDEKEIATMQTHDQGSFQMITKNTSIVEDRQTSTRIEQVNMPVQSKVSQNSVPAINNQNPESETSFYEFEATNSCTRDCYSANDESYELSTYESSITMEIKSIYSISSEKIDNKRQLNKMAEKQVFIDGQKYVIEIENIFLSEFLDSLGEQMDISFGSTRLTDIEENGFTKFVP